MAKGATAKKEVIKVLLDTFGDKAFLYNDGKEIRVNWQEDGALCQIKIALTAAKEAVTPGGDIALPGENAEMVTSVRSEESVSADMRPTEQEQQNVKDLLKFLNF